MKKLNVASILLVMGIVAVLPLPQQVKSATGNYKPVEIGSPRSLQNCFAVDPAIGSTNRDDHYGWAQQQDSVRLTNNLPYKIGLLFNCPSVSGEQLANAFADISVIIANYVSNPACFKGDEAVVGRDRSAHERWARTKTRNEVRDNLQWKAAAAVKCLERSAQNGYFADVSVAVARVVSANSGGGGGGGGGGTLRGDWDIKCCNDELGWTLTITNQDGAAFSGSFSANTGGGIVTNGQVRGNTIEFDRVESGSATPWRQHWSAQLVNDGGRLRMINGIWTGSYLDRYPGRNNFHAEKK